MSNRYAVLVKPWAVYVKTWNFYVEQGGLTQPWGREWKSIAASSIEGARRKGMEMRS